MDLENNPDLRDGVIMEIHPDPEKFWITFHNYIHKGAVNKTIINGNAHTFVDFSGTDRRPTDVEDLAEMFKIRVIRFIADSKILQFIPESSINKIEIIRIYDIQSINYPAEDYYLYIPTINMLFLQKNMKLDKSLEDTFPMAIAIQVIPGTLLTRN